MVDSTGRSKPRDTLLERLRERIKDRDRALEVRDTQINNTESGVQSAVN